jgi:agmatine deiminase
MRAPFFQPVAEWAPQTAVWVGWPRLREEWGAAFEGARCEIAAIVNALRPHVTVKLAAGDEVAAQAARERLGSACTVHTLPSGDIWLRDTGPVFIDHAGRIEAVCFDFNGWGGKFMMPGDDATAEAIAAAEALRAWHHPFVLEGGAVECDGTGTAITTRSCLLNANRNPGWDTHAAEAALAGALGVERIIWLDEGLLNDHTDGHVDNLARFVRPGHVVCQRPANADDPNSGRLVAIEAALREAGLDVSTLPSPGRINDADGMALPASHLNFLITNGAVLMPDFATPSSAEATHILQDLFPGRKVIGVAAREILSGGGSVHCMTCNVAQASAPIGGRHGGA